VILRSLDAPSPRPLENGDTRPLLLGVKHLTTALEPSPVSVEEIVNENGLEQVGGEPFFWMGKGTTKVMIQSSRAGHLILEAGFTPGPSLPGVALRRVHVTTDHGHDSIVKILAGRQSLQVPIPQGRTVVSLTPLDLPTVRTLPNGDSRPLLLGVHGLSPFLETN
jgi:hypothetical protein